VGRFINHLPFLDQLAQKAVAFLQTALDAPGRPDDQVEGKGGFAQEFQGLGRRGRPGHWRSGELALSVS
jgi:hypothetical protein